MGFVGSGWVAILCVLKMSQEDDEIFEAESPSALLLKHLNTNVRAGRTGDDGLTKQDQDAFDLFCLYRIWCHFLRRPPAMLLSEHLTVLDFPGSTWSALLYVLKMSQQEEEIPEAESSSARYSWVDLEYCISICISNDTLSYALYSIKKEESYDIWHDTIEDVHDWVIAPAAFKNFPSSALVLVLEHLNDKRMVAPQLEAHSPCTNGLMWQDQTASELSLESYGAPPNPSLTFSDKSPLSPVCTYFDHFLSQLQPHPMFKCLRYPRIKDYFTSLSSFIRSLSYKVSPQDTCTFASDINRVCRTHEAEGCSLGVRDDEIINPSVDEKLDLRLQCMQICEPAGCQSGPEALPDREMIQVDSLQHEEIVECVATNNGGNGGGKGQTLTAVTLSMKNKTNTSAQKYTNDKPIGLVDLEGCAGMIREDAANWLGVSISTFKRRCRKHGIDRWSSRKFNKDKQSLSTSTGKGVTKSVRGAEGSHNPTSLCPKLLPGAVGSVSWPASLNESHQGYIQGSKPPELWGKKNESFSYKTQANDRWVEEGEQMQGRRASAQTKLIHEQIRFLPPELGKEPNRSKMENGSKEESIRTLTSHDLCHGNSITNETPPAMDLFISPTLKECVEVGMFSKLAFEPTELSLSPSQALPFTELQRPPGGIVIENTGSSNNLRNFFPSAAEADWERWISESSCTDPLCSYPASKQAMATLPHSMPHVASEQDTKIMTIKATYREDTIKFRLSSTSGIDELKEEVAKRLKIEADTFGIKYLDGDGDRILIACDGDLKDFMNDPSSLGNNKIRLQVHDRIDNSRKSSKSCWGSKRKRV